MDMLRSAYECEMQLVHNGPPVKVLWYRCDENAKDFPGSIRYGSRNYTNRTESTSIGETTAPIKYRKGNDAGGGAIGLNHCGSLETFANGATSESPLFACDPVTGVGPCCIAVPPNAVPIGGVLISGTALVDVPAGGATVGGTAEVSATPIVFGEGGSWVGGDAQVSATPIVVGVGGFVINAEALVDTSPNIFKWISDGIGGVGNKAGQYRSFFIPSFVSDGIGGVGNEAGQYHSIRNFKWVSDGIAGVGNEAGTYHNVRKFVFVSDGIAGVGNEAGTYRENPRKFFSDGIAGVGGGSGEYFFIPA